MGTPESYTSTPSTTPYSSTPSTTTYSSTPSTTASTPSATASTPSTTPYGTATTVSTATPSSTPASTPYGSTDSTSSTTPTTTEYGATTTTTTGDEPNCFPGDSTVLLEGRWIQMADVEADMHVLTGDGFEPLVNMLHVSTPPTNSIVSAAMVKTSV